MNKKISHRMWIVTILLFSFSIFSPALNASSAQDEDAKVYKQAYSLVLEENWEEAHKALEKFIQEYSRSAWIDDARFWQCYAREKLDYALEDVYGCYDKFIKAYPKSKWVDDAKSNMVRVAHRLAKENNIFNATDDCSLILNLKLAPVYVVEGSQLNIKITYPLDLQIAQKIIEIEGEKI